MIFYVSLFLGCLIAASIVIWVYRVLSHASHKTYRSILPSSRDAMRSAAVDGVIHARTASAGSPAPWGWKKSENTTGRVGVSGPSGAKSQVGWPYRDEPFDFGKHSLGETKPGTKVVKVRKASKGGIDKPWGW